MMAHYSCSRDPVSLLDLHCHSDGYKVEVFWLFFHFHFHSSSYILLISVIYLMNYPINLKLIGQTFFLLYLLKGTTKWSHISLRHASGVLLMGLFSLTTDSLMFHDLCTCLIIHEQKMFEESESLLSTLVFVLSFFILAMQRLLV